MKAKKQAQAVLRLVAVLIGFLTAFGQAMAEVDKEVETKVVSTLAALKSHIQGETTLEPAQIEAHKSTIDSHPEIFGQSKAIIKASFDLAATYEQTQEPNWIVSSGFHRKKGIPNNMKWTMFSVMQNIVDHVYTAENIAKHHDLLDGFKFKCADHFPGKVEPPQKSGKAHTVKISGSFPKTFGRLEEGFARKPTGTYLAPGTIATVKVPKSLVGKGYTIRVGSHSWNFHRKPRIKRLDRISLVYAIDNTKVKVANPLGGGIYIEVPYLADAGVVEVKVTNAVRSPYFSMKSFHKTSLSEWRNTERNYRAPFADFQTEKFMMNVPTNWIYKLDDPVTLMKDWDMAIDAMNDLMGLPRIRGRETMYPQVDLMMKAGAYAPGYPSSNLRYSPAKDFGGYAKHHLVRGPKYASSYEFHEQGHGFFFVKFPGEVESAVNLPHVAVWNQKFGYSLDEAFRASRRAKDEFRTLETTAVTWMTSPNFSKKIPMEPSEKKYQLKGHAKFVDIVRLLGWKVLGDFWYSLNLDFENGKEWPRHRSDIDKLLLRLTKSTKVDIRPLFHFWGTPPKKPDALKVAIEAEKLPSSAKIYDTLVKYKSLVPEDNKAFQDFTVKWWEKQPRIKGYTTERGHAEQWDTYNEEACARIKMIVQEIIDTYFPDGRPETGMTLTDASATKKAAASSTAKRAVKELQEDFRKLNFGMFLHYNMATYKGVQWVVGYPDPSDFNPGGKVDTDAWADAAVAAGMKYGVLTAKHVAGFCLWDSKYTTYDVMHPDCPYQQDLVGQFIESFKSRGLKVGLYYCWRHPGFDEKYKVVPPECDPATHTLKEQNEFQMKQIAELIEMYPDVFYIWNDALDDKVMPAEEAADFFNRTRPDILTSSNWWDWGKKGTPFMDIGIKELRHFPEDNTAPGETCWCLEQSWFWNEAASPKTAKQVIDIMNKVYSRNSNFLLNVGPNKNGKFEDASIKVLAEVGKLLKSK